MSPRHESYCSYRRPYCSYCTYCAYCAHCSYCCVRQIQFVRTSPKASGTTLIFAIGGRPIPVKDIDVSSHENTGAYSRHQRSLNFAHLQDLDDVPLPEDPNVHRKRVSFLANLEQPDCV